MKKGPETQGRMLPIDERKIQWVYPHKKKILFGLLGLFSMVLLATMALIVFLIRDSLMQESVLVAQELGDAVNSSLRSLMIKRDPMMIQDTLKSIGAVGDPIVKVFIIDNRGKIIYSSDEEDVGLVLERRKEESCAGCHGNVAESPPETTIITRTRGEKVHRNVKVIYNEEPCFGCHPSKDRINGKIIIDRSMRRTDALVLYVETVILLSGFLALAVVFPFLSRRVDRFIKEIVRQHSELMLMYMMVERLSKTIDISELKDIILEIIRDTFDADEVDLVLLKESGGYNCYSLGKDSEKVQRKDTRKDDDLHEALMDWLKRSLRSEAISDDRKRVYIPIEKGNKDLALISARNFEEPFSPIGLEVLKVISGHIAAALENARLYVLAITDELTGLYSYRHLLHSVSKQLFKFERAGEGFAVLMLDIDDFKKINDTYGHLAGDTMLREMAVCVLESIRDNDLAFRYGGEEFAVLLPATDKPGARHVAERVRERVENAVFLKGELDLKATISVGISLCPENAEGVRELLHAADRALYDAKLAGKNRVVTSTAKKHI